MSIDKSVIQQEKELSDYLTEWSLKYNNVWRPFYFEISQNKKDFRDKVAYSDQLLDFLDDLDGNIEKYFSVEEGKNLIPSSFASIDRVIGWIMSMKFLLKSNYPLIELNHKKREPNYYISNIHRVMVEFDSVIDRCLKIYSLESELPLPYHKLRAYLISDNIDGFISQLRNILASIPYGIRREAYNEAFFHISIHTILTVLGFSLISEKETNLGRIDMSLSIDNRTYILEFKYSKQKSMASEALSQIKKKKYADQYKLGSSKIVGVGVSFSHTERNIQHHKSEILYEESIDRNKMI